MPESKNKSGAGASPLTTSQQNLLVWIANQYVEHTMRGPVPGTTLNIAKARRFLLRAKMPDEVKENLVKKTEWMLREHAEAAYDVLQIESAVKSGKSKLILENP
jgi:hypothetical protein